MQFERFVLVCLLLITVKSSKGKKKRDEEVLQFIEGNLGDLKHVTYKCIKSQISYLLWLKENKSADTTVFCALSVLKNVKVSLQEKKYAWALLHQIFPEKRKSKFASKQIFSKNENILFKNSWAFLGPFQIGKTEFDGNPIDAIGRKNAITNRWNPKYEAYSELIANGVVRWTTISSDHNKALQLVPNVNWNDLMMTLQSIGVAEWQGWIVNEFVIGEDKSYVKVQCLGVNVFYIDGRLANGDIYHREHYWYPLRLDSGIHVIEAPVRAKGNTAVKCDIVLDKKSRGLVVHHVKFIPDFVDGNQVSSIISLDATNMDSRKDTVVLVVHVTKHDFDQEPFVTGVGEQRLAASQVGSIILELNLRTDEVKKKCKRENYSMNLKIETNINTEDVKIVFRCRSSSQSFLFTFMDHDGSVQHAAAVKPLKRCQLMACPVLLTLHGTGVKAENQADSYKQMKNNRYVFGVEKLWLLAPTRHGAHNWEGPGELTAMTALEKLDSLTRKALWLGQAANTDVVVFAGHSMGGHGAWQLAVHNPDKALAVISAAGWLSKEDYGDSNLFYHHDISISHTDPVVKSIQESCVAENQADKHASNLKGIPVLIRIGANDRTVHPYFTRRMWRLLEEYKVNVTYKEFPGKEHWWWDTTTANDGGVTNDVEIRTFATYAVQRYEEEKQYCDAEGCGQPKSTSSKYSKPQDRKREGNFHYVLYNPASFSGGCGIKIIQQAIPFRKTFYDVNIHGATIIITTNNIQQLQLYEPILEPVGWLFKSIVIDEQSLIRPTGELPWKLCQHRHMWKLCDSSKNIRDMKNYGPARRIAENPFIVVVCNNGKQSDVNMIRNAATFLVNLFYLTSDAVTTIFTSSELTEQQLMEQNVIIFGTSSCLRDVNTTELIHFTDRNVKLGDCTFPGKNLSALYLLPHGTDKLMMLVTGQSPQSIRDGVMTLAIPTIPPMTRSPFSNLIPDYVIMSPYTLAKGPGGYICSGFWSNSWTYDVTTSSCNC